MRAKLALISMVIVLGLVNWSIAGKVTHLTDGKVVYLKLAPVDPRSLMQGDYMALRFDVARAVRDALPKGTRGWGPDGHVVVSLDDKGIGTFKGLYTQQPLTDNETLMLYRVRGGQVKFATNAFFFQEGHADIYESAAYGQFRVDGGGELLLVAMYDENLKKLEPAE